MPKHNPQVYLDDIQEAIEKIIQYTKGMSFDDFMNDSKTVDAVVRNIAIIGEAVVNLPEEFKEEHSDIPWQDIVGMRNKVIHEYFGVDDGILWQTVIEDIPTLKKYLSAFNLG